MAIEAVKRYLAQFNLDGRVVEFDVSSATVALAAQALGCESARIAKTLSFLLNDGSVVLIVAAGDVKVDNAKFKAQFSQKARMIPAQSVEEAAGHAVGGVCPFAVAERVRVYLDRSLARFDIVYPACGSANSAIALSPRELECVCDRFAGWIDVCKPING